MRGKRIGLWAPSAAVAPSPPLLRAAAEGATSLGEHRHRGSRLDARRDPGEGEGRGRSQPRDLGRLCRQVVGGRLHKQTGCKVNTKDGASSDDMVDLMATGAYDGVSASGDATLRLIAKGDVAPVNFDLIPNYADVFDGLKTSRTTPSTASAYGVPHGRGANLLVFDNDILPANTTAGRRFGTGTDSGASCRSTTTRSSSPTPPST